ncbi:hypothetical protein K438DRAFT_1749845 [Mycena galopus ATCC 62051]|nr:hypothetical protein K438DRAFT_1749845 [Mycena galopus ATCC 62051]
MADPETRAYYVDRRYSDMDFDLAQYMREVRAANGGGIKFHAFHAFQYYMNSLLHGIFSYGIYVIWNAFWVHPESGWGNIPLTAIRNMEYPGCLKRPSRHPWYRLKDIGQTDRLDTLTQCGLVDTLHKTLSEHRGDREPEARNGRPTWPAKILQTQPTCVNSPK